jgi:hypothetical protein
MVVNNCAFDANLAGLSGDAVENQGTMTVTNSRFVENEPAYEFVAGEAGGARSTTTARSRSTAASSRPTASSSWLTGATSPTSGR